MTRRTPSGQAPPYYLGRSAAVWRGALARSRQRRPVPPTH